MRASRSLKVLQTISEDRWEQTWWTHLLEDLLTVPASEALPVFLGSRLNKLRKRMRGKLFWSLIVPLFLLACVQADKRLEVEQKILTDIFKGYDKTVRPSGQNGTGPVIVEINVFVRRIDDIDDVNMRYGTQLTFRQKWLDPRLRYNNQGLEYVTVSDPSKLWIPDVFFSNELRGHFHDIVTPNILMRIFPNGTILYSNRISLELGCNMDLSNYPMDNQMCELVCASYGYTTKDIVFQWKTDTPVQISKTIFLPKFMFSGFGTHYCTSKTNTGEYSCIKITMDFSRKFTFYLLQAFMPSTFLVLLSWATFWLNPRNLGIRIGIWIGVLLSMVIVTTSVADSGPEVSYIKAIDIWMGTCMVFIFCVLIETAFVNHALSGDGGRMVTHDENNMCIEEAKGNKMTDYTSTPLKWLNKYSTKAQRIDAISRFVFPTAFAFFNFIYWLTYCAK